MLEETIGGALAGPPAVLAEMSDSCRRSGQDLAEDPGIVEFAHGRISFVSAKAVCILGLSREDLIGHPAESVPIPIGEEETQPLDTWLTKHGGAGAIHWAFERPRR